MTGWRDRLASLRVPYADVAPLNSPDTGAAKVSPLVIYDIQTDMFRPAT